MQVCSLLWNPHDKEILAGLGFSHNQLGLWKYPSCQKVAELFGHTERVLHMALSPDGTTVCRCAGTPARSLCLPAVHFRCGSLCGGLYVTHTEQQPSHCDGCCDAISE